MDYEVSFSKPHRVFLSDEKMEELEITVGDPVEVDFDKFDTPVVAKCSNVSELNHNEETHALFFLIHYCIDELSEVHGDLFEPFTETSNYSNPEFGDFLKTKSGMRMYLSRIHHFNKYRFSDCDVIIGCGIADILARKNLDKPREISSPFSQHTISVVHQALTGKLADPTELSLYSGSLRTPSNMYICTYNYNPTKEQKENLKEHVISDKYIIPYYNYEYQHGTLPAHGPMLDSDEEISEEDVIIATNDNIKFIRSRNIIVNILQDTSYGVQDLHGYLKEEFESDGEIEFEIEYREKRNQIYLDLNTLGSIQVNQTDDGYHFKVNHPQDDDIRDIEGLVRQITLDLEEKLDAELETSMNPRTPMSPVTNDTWVMDTNSIYRQKPWESYNSISEFLLSNSIIFGKEIHIPWNVLCEINRHKDANSSKTQSASDQGLENLNILKILDDYNLIDVQIESIPDAIDNSIIKNTGATDLKITNTVPEDGVLLTDDNHLLELGNIIDVETASMDDISGFSKRESEDPYWLSLHETLSNEGPIEVSKTIENLEELEIKEERNIVEKEPDQVLHEKLSSREIIKYTENDAVHIALTETIPVIPTFSLINDIQRRTRDINGDTYITGNALESIRSAIGGLPKTHRPFLRLIIPSEYVFRTSEVQQIDSLEQIRHISNCDFETVHHASDIESSENVENALIRLSIDNDYLILCSPQEDTRKYNLLDIDYATVTFN